MNYNTFIDSLFLEAVENSYIIRDELYPTIEKVLSTPQGDKKFKQIVGQYMDKHSIALHKCGPVDLIPFADNDKAMYYNLFNITEKEVKAIVAKVLKSIGSSSDFKLLTNNPMFFVFYCCIRYYTLKKDEKGINTALAIYSLSVYPSIFSLFYKYGANEGVMQYTMDHLTEKYILKQGGHLFGGLFLSIKHSYSFLGQYMKDGSDKEVIRFIQRIRNDQKSMFRNITDVYMKNYNLGLRVNLTKDNNSADMQLDVDAENNTTAVERVSINVTNGILTNGTDLRRITQSANIAGISVADARYYISKIVSVKYTDEIEKMVHAMIFLFLYTNNKKKEDINSSYFLKWASETFRKTNSNDENIGTIKNILDKWGEETGVHAKYKREGTRINYKKAIYWYFILSIQYYNK